jgi:hypothetical protein
LITTGPTGDASPLIVFILIVIFIVPKLTG